ncbi:MAG: SUMF1/EgtB/PvdO family nonheme iron enzyme [Bacteroidales bacterium]|nr:SUMF1/EgtB/PvdO family nonheme iron enzyme [Bacteroidales bacterium]
MLRKLLMTALGAVMLCSCAKEPVTPETDEPENPEIEQPADKPAEDSAKQGFKLTFRMDGITRLEIECVDAYPLTADGASIITYTENLEPGKEYTIGTVPCNVYGGYRLSIFRAGKVAHFFGVHQVIEEGTFISPLDLDESELEFDDPDAPLVEEERPELDKKTKELLRAYKSNPSDENYQALYDQMGVRYDKVVARKKAKLRELEREAHHQSLIDEMQAIVDEMVTNREERLWQRFLSLIDSRKDDNPDDEWLVLKGAWQENAYVGYAPVTNEEYKAYKADFTYPSGQERYPVVNISYDEAVAYCNWLSAKDASHTYRLPSEYEWILAAGHMPKDVKMNANHIEPGITSVDAYASSKGGCGGIDFWGNCWEWTSTLAESGKYIIKGGAWDSSRDECRSEYSDASRDGSKGYANVGVRVVRVDSEGVSFASSSCTADSYTIPYRYTQINPKDGVIPIVVLVLRRRS